MAFKRFKIDQGPTITLAKNARLGANYWTAQSSSRYLTIPVSFTVNGGVLMRHWNNDTKEWQEIVVDGDYKLNPIKEGKVKLPAGGVKKRTETNGSKKDGSTHRLGNLVGATTKKDPEKTWGIAFEKHGKKGEDEIVSFMKKEFPTVTKKWESWTNHFRQKYNNGELGNSKPKEPIQRFGGKREKAAA